MRTWIAVALFIFANCSFGHAQSLSQQEIEALQAKIMQNWNPPVGNDGQTIIVRIRLNRDGTLRVGPQILTAGSGSLFNALKDSAAKAVLLSAPYTMFRQDSYEAWKELDFTFDPRSVQPKQTNRSAATQAGPPASGKPSFDCSKATSASARLICSDAELSKADGALGAKFKNAVAGRDEAAKKQLVGEQLTWLRERNIKCGVGPDKASVPVVQLTEAKPCMVQAIEERIASLSSNQVASDTSIYYIANTTPPDAFLSLRTDPASTSGQRVMTMPNGTRLRVLQRRTDGWWYVKVIPTGQEGWALSGQGNNVWIECCATEETAQATEFSGQVAAQVATMPGRAPAPGVNTLEAQLQSSGLIGLWAPGCSTGSKAPDFAAFVFDKTRGALMIGGGPGTPIFNISKFEIIDSNTFRFTFQKLTGPVVPNAISDGTMTIRRDEQKLRLIDQRSQTGEARIENGRIIEGNIELSPMEKCSDVLFAQLLGQSQLAMPQTPSVAAAAQTKQNAVNSKEAVATALRGKMHDGDKTIMRDGVILEGYAVQNWTHPSGMGGETLLKYHAAKNQWIVLETDGGGLDVARLVSLGVPQNLATALVTNLSALEAQRKTSAPKKIQQTANRQVGGLRITFVPRYITSVTVCPGCSGQPTTQGNFLEMDWTVEDYRVRGVTSCYSTGDNQEGVFSSIVDDDNSIRVFIDDEKLIRMLNSLREGAFRKCTEALKAGVLRDSNVGPRQIPAHFTAYANRGPFQGFRAHVDGLDTAWIVEHNLAKANELQRQAAVAAQERARQAQLAAQRVKDTKRSEFWAKYGVQGSVTGEELATNPFFYKNKVVHIEAMFDRMLSENEAVFSFGPGIILTNVPSTVFRGKERATIAVKVLGNKTAKGLFGADVTVPYGEYLGAYDCSDIACSDY